MKDFWLQCNISDGQFRGEYAVSAIDSSGNDFSLFSCEDELDRQRQRLRVKPLVKGEGVVLIELPRETLENGRTVTVKQSDVSPSIAQEAAKADCEEASSDDR